jgi:hypothetical protein
VSTSRSRYAAPGEPRAGGRSTEIGISISKSFDFGMGHRQKSANLQAKSEQKSLESQISNVRTDLQGDFIRYRSASVASQEYSTIFQQVEGQLETAISQVEQTHQGDMVFIMELLGTYSGRYWNMTQKKKEVINLKFSIQRRIGTLFDQVTQFATMNPPQ